MPTSGVPGRFVLFSVVAVVAGAIDELWFLGAKHAHAGRVGAWVLPLWLGGILILAATALLLTRRRRALQVFVAVWALAVFSLFFRDWLFIGCFAVALYRVAAATIRWVAVAALLAAAVVVTVESTFSVGSDSPDPVGEALVRWALFALVMGIAWSLGRYHHFVGTRERETRERHAAESAAAVQAERLRLSRELHDIVSHTVSVMTLQAAGARTLVGRDDERVVGSLRVIEQAGVEAMNELARLLSVLRAEDGEAGDELAVQPRLEDLPQLVALANSAGQDVELDLSGEPGRLDPSVALACYRVVQEALTNARKYAGQQALVRVNLSWRPPQLVVTVRNDAGSGAAGSEPAPRGELSTGHGLHGLAERVGLVGGELESGPTSGGGFLIRATLPVAAAGTLHPAPVPETDPDAWASFD